MERGQIAEQGSHAELLRNPTGIYHHLYQLQQGVQENITDPAMPSGDLLYAPVLSNEGAY